MVTSSAGQRSAAASDPRAALAPLGSAFTLEPIDTATAAVCPSASNCGGAVRAVRFRQQRAAAGGALQSRKRFRRFEQTPSHTARKTKKNERTSSEGEGWTSVEQGRAECDEEEHNQPSDRGARQRSTTDGRSSRS